MKRTVKLKTLLKNKKVQDIIAYAISGAHSGIPECCIVFFSFVWLKNQKNDVKWKKKTKKYFQRLVELNSVYKINYVPCPKCLEEKKFVKIHFCRANNERCKEYSKSFSKSISRGNTKF